MNVKRKILGILICVLMLTTIPLAAGMTVDSEPDDPETTDIGRTIIRGFVFNYKPSGFGHKFFALRIHYIEITGTTRTTGVVIMKQCIVGRERNIGFNWCGPVGFFGYMFASTFRGGIDF
jgi:hypothetical protein